MYFGYQAIPCSATTPARYAAFLVRSLNPNSIPGYLNIIRIMHLEAGFKNPLQNWVLQTVLKGIKRLNGVPAKRKLLITIDILFAIYNKLDTSSSFNRTFWAASLVGFFSFLRKASLLPKSLEGDTSVY